jgi:hypothetical protein
MTANPIITNIKSELFLVSDRIKSEIPNSEVFSIHHSNWSFPSITGDELIRYVENLISFIDEREEEIDEKDGIYIRD